MTKQFIIYLFTIVLVYNLHISYVTASDIEIVDVPENHIDDSQFSLSGIQSTGYSADSGFGQGIRRQYNLLTTKDDSCSVTIKTRTQSRKIETEEEKIMSGLLIGPKDTKTLFGWKIEKDTSYFKEAFTRNNVIVESYGTGICSKKVRGLLKKIKMKDGEIYESIPSHSLVQVKPNYDKKRYILQTGILDISILDTEKMILGVVTEDAPILFDVKLLFEKQILEEGLSENIIEYDSLKIGDLNMRYIVMKTSYGGEYFYITTYLLPDIYGRVIMTISKKDDARQNLIDFMGPIEIRSDNLGLDSYIGEVDSDVIILKPPSLQEIVDSNQYIR